MTGLGACLIGIPVAIFGYAYLVYPALLWLVAALKPRRPVVDAPAEWPGVTVILPCYNEEATVARTLEGLLALDYPSDRLHLLVASDASTDRTDEIVASFATRGVELLRLRDRGGKSAAENAAAARVRGEIVVNTDATTRILPGSLKALIREFQDPTVGVATGRAVAVGDLDAGMNLGEAKYTDYEMWVRSLETRVGSVVGASGCFFASRRTLYAGDFPPGLSRDFASCLIAHELGYRAVSVPTAPCLVPLSSSLRTEVRRKTRTMARGLDTLWFKRQLLNPFRHGGFAWMLFSHKLARWLFQLTWPLGVLGLIVLASTSSLALSLTFGATCLVAVAAIMAYRWPEGRSAPRFIAVPGFAVWANVAGANAWFRFVRGTKQAIWEPTRRPA